MTTHSYLTARIDELCEDGVDERTAFDIAYRELGDEGARGLKPLHSDRINPPARFDRRTSNG